MKLSQFLKLSRTGSRKRSIIADNIGDSILFNQCQLYENVRKVFLKNGGSATQIDHCNYFSSKLLALDKMKKNRRIPYLPNMLALKEAEKVRPGHFKLNDFIEVPLIGNSIFHESCHLIVHNLLEKKGAAQLRKNKRDFLVSIVFEEAFTDTAETLLVLASTTEAMRFSARYNTYVNHLSDEVRKDLQQIINRFGFQNAAKMLMLLSLSAHFLIKTFDKKLLQKKLSFINIASANQKDYQVLSRIAQVMVSLVVSYRVNVCRNYFISIGLSRNVSQILNFDPMEILEKDKAQWLLNFNTLCKMLQPRAV